MGIEYSIYTPPTPVIVLLCVHAPRGLFRVLFWRPFAEAAAEVPAAGVPAAVIPMGIEYSIYTPPTPVIVLLCVHTPRGPFRVRFCAVSTFLSLSNSLYG